MEYSLSMTFINTSGDKVSLTITDVKSGLTQAEVAALMDSVIAKNVFTSKGGDLVSKYGAQLTQRQTTKYEVK